MKKNIIDLPRSSKQIILLLSDVVLVILALKLSFALRLGYWEIPNGALLFLILFAPIIAIPIFLKLDLYNTIIRFIGFEVLWTIFKSVTLYALFWAVFAFLSGASGLPRSVILINWVLTILLISSSRFIARWVLLYNKNDLNQSCINVIIYGAGSAGRQLLNALIQSSKYNPIALIDDSKELYRKKINGIEVISQKDLSSEIESNDIKEILLAIPSISRNRRREIIEFLEPFSVVVRSLPSVSDIAQGKVKIDDLLQIDIQELLGREKVEPNKKLLSIKVTDKVVLITGAGGSIGSELSRQIIKLNPKKIIILDVSESSLYQIEQELLLMQISNVQIISKIGSISDKLRIENILSDNKVQTIYHAAAYKHVPLVESNPSQGVLNNAFGTKILAEAAILSRVETFVLVSTDKAVRPTSTMGVAKRVAELILQALSKEKHNTCFTMVRFGNVLDSSGSVIPLFKQQIRNGGPVTVTDVSMVRYFMTIPEAVELVIQAGAMAYGGDVFVLDMGKPVLINDLAIKMIKLSGLTVRNAENPDGDIEISYTGIRPGEKLYEELLVDYKTVKTEHDLIMRANEKMIEWESLKPMLEKLKHASMLGKKDSIKKSLKDIVPEYKLK